MIDLHAIAQQLADPLKHSLQNQFLSGGVLLMALGAIAAYFRKLPGRGWDWLQRRVIITLEVSNEDPVYLWMVNWLAAQPYSRKARNLTVTSRRDGNNNLTSSPGEVAGSRR